MGVRPLYWLVFLLQKLQVQNNGKENQNKFRSVLYLGVAYLVFLKMEIYQADHDIFHLPVKKLQELKVYTFQIYVPQIHL